jgi:hypothetical protein
MPAQIRRQFFHGGLEVPDSMDQRYRDSFQQMLKMARALYDAGILIVVGTDGMAGFTLHRELELYVQAGIPALKVLSRAHHETRSGVGIDRSWKIGRRDPGGG